MIKFAGRKKQEIGK